MTRVIASIYKTRRKEGMYLIVPKAAGLNHLPEALLAQFGTPIHAYDLLLTPERTLARADILQVLEKLTSQGFYLQMPPPPEPWQIQAEQAPAWRRMKRDEHEQ